MFFATCILPPGSIPMAKTAGIPRPDWREGRAGGVGAGSSHGIGGDVEAGVIMVGRWR